MYHRGKRASEALKHLFEKFKPSKPPEAIELRWTILEEQRYS